MMNVDALSDHLSKYVVDILQKKGNRKTLSASGGGCEERLVFE